jgi:hypothetical protein
VRDASSTIPLDTIAATHVYGPRPARDSTVVGGISVPDFTIERRRIIPKRRWRLARDIATAPSQDSSTFSMSSAGLDAEAGA